MVARVETITDPEEQQEEPEGEELDFGLLHHISDELAVDLGFKVSHPSIAVSPIAIYR